MSILLSRTRLGDVELKNRVVMAPMTRCRATTEHVPTELMAEYYAQRASAGLLITEGTAPDPNGCGYARIPGAWSLEQVEGWKKVTAAAHDKGAKLAMQLMHTGRVSHPLNMPQGARVLSPSATTAPGEMYTDQEGPQPYPQAEEMTAPQIEATIEGFVTAAKNAAKAGFDFVEVHGANGYLVEQFLAKNTNQRTDEWGGSFEKRARFALEVCRRIAAAIGAERVGIRLSPYGVFNGIEPWETVSEDYEWLAQQLGKLGIGYLHTVDHSSMGAPQLPEDLLPRLRTAFPKALILSGGYDQARAEADLEAKRGDLVAFARHLLANPDLVQRFEQGASLNQPNMDTFYTPGPVGYTDYPTLAAS
jgi:N-ethylmaleimide reductase